MKANGSKVKLHEKATNFFSHLQPKFELGMKYLYECSVGYPVTESKRNSRLHQNSIKHLLKTTLTITICGFHFFLNFFYEFMVCIPCCKVAQ